jgi:hypothetical protein
VAKNVAKKYIVAANATTDTSNTTLSTATAPECLYFTARLERAETQAEVFATGGLYYIVVPTAVALQFTTGKPIRIVCLLDGRCERHGAVRSRGVDRGFFIGFGKDVVAKAALLLGYEYDIAIWKDDDDYGLEPCAEFAEVLEQDPAAKAVWDSFTDGKKRSHLIYVNQAKSEQVRIKRALEMAYKYKTDTLYTRKKP